MPSIRRQAITLLEVVIVIIILSIASGAVAISINKALVDQRFRTEVGLIVDELRLAQDLMLILGTDVHLHFAESKDNQGIEYWLQLETRVSPSVERELLRKRKVLKTIKGVFLEDELLSDVQESHIDVKFLSNGAVMSKGIMRLATSSDEKVPSGTLENYICLAGYPKPISSSRDKKEAEDNCQKFEEDLDERLTKDTIARLPEKLLKTQENPVEPAEKAQTSSKTKKPEEK